MGHYARKTWLIGIGLAAFGLIGNRAFAALTAEQLAVVKNTLTAAAEKLDANWKAMSDQKDIVQGRMDILQSERSLIISQAELDFLGAVLSMFEWTGFFSLIGTMGSWLQFQGL